MGLTRKQVAFYEKNGYLVVPDVVPEEHLARLRAKFDEMIITGPKEGPTAPMQEPEVLKGKAGVALSATTVRKFGRLVPYEPMFRDLAATPGFLDMVEDLIGRPIEVWNDQSQLKPPRAGSAKPPHQDNAYHLITPEDLTVTLWLAVDDADLDNGCMHFAPGSHKLGLLPHEPLSGQEHNLSPVGVELGALVATPCSAGTVAFFHTLVVHYSPPDRTDRWRRSFICHYINASAKLEHDHWPVHVRVRVRDYEALGHCASPA